MAQSLNLLPFRLDGNFVSIAIPARRGLGGHWEVLDASAMRTEGFRETSRRFRQIDRAMREDEVVKPLHEKINERNKLTQQVFPPDQYLVLNGAGGGIACAACLPLAQHQDIVIDQTLYWTLAPSEDAAWYRVGLINTDALTEAIREFNPEGELGPRHLHSLPNRIIAPFDPGNLEHHQIAALARELSALAQLIIDGDPNILDPMKTIASRRRRLRVALQEFPEYEALEDACASLISIPS